MAIYSLFFDGAADKKNRTLSFGFWLRLDRKPIDLGYGIVGLGDSGSAELHALSHGLDAFVRKWNKPDSVLNIYGDSKSALRDAEKNPITKFKLKEIRGWGVKVKLLWIPRSENKKANSLAKKLRVASRSG
jgi:ribonuclease HI